MGLIISKRKIINEKLLLLRECVCTEVFFQSFFFPLLQKQPVHNNKGLPGKITPSAIVCYQSPPPQIPPFPFDVFPWKIERLSHYASERHEEWILLQKQEDNNSDFKWWTVPNWFREWLMQYTGFWCKAATFSGFFNRTKTAYATL